jgi:hypothetical protein
VRTSGFLKGIGNPIHNIPARGCDEAALETRRAGSHLQTGSSAGDTVMFTSTELLRFLGMPGSHVVRTADAWVIRTAAGSDFEADLGGFAFSPVAIPDAQFADLERARLIAGDSEDVWRLTRTAREARAA